MKRLPSFPRHAFHAAGAAVALALVPITTDHVMRLRIELTPTADGTCLRWRWRWIVTGPKGNGVVDDFSDEHHAKLVAGLETLLRYYLEHGAMPPPEPDHTDS